MSPKFIFNRDNARSAMALGKLERAAMDILWEEGEMSGSELYRKVGKKLRIRHNTLLTVLERLIAKGFLAKRKEGRNNFFKPLISRDEYCLKIAVPLLKELLDVSSGSVLSAFVDNACRDNENIDELKHLIDEMEKKNKTKKNRGES